MMIAPVGYRVPGSVDAALALLREDPQACWLAGGQSLLSAMKLGLQAPSRLVDLQALAALRGISCEAGVLSLGAMATHHEIARDVRVREALPGLAALAQGIGDAQIRRRGTVGGSLANNDPAACWPAALLALGGRVRTDRRTIDADDLVGGLFETALEPDELIVNVEFPVAVPFVYLKIEQPASRFALAGLALARLSKGVRVAVTGVTDRACRLRETERMLDARFEEHALPAEPVEDIDWLDDLHAGGDYRRHLCGRLLRRAVRALGDGAQR
jgi:carbon-monoxide dehydrogenase medium subunit